MCAGDARRSTPAFDVSAPASVPGWRAAEGRSVFFRRGPAFSFHERSPQINCCVVKVRFMPRGGVVDVLVHATDVWGAATCLREALPFAAGCCVCRCGAGVSLYNGKERWRRKGKRGRVAADIVCVRERQFFYSAESPLYSCGCQAARTNRKPNVHSSERTLHNCGKYRQREVPCFRMRAGIIKQ